MKKLLAGLGTASAVFSILINLHPDIGIKVLLFTIFGILFFGITWTRMGVQGIVEGLIIGVIIGFGNGLIVASAEHAINNTPDYFIGIKPILHLAKWGFPILFNSLVIFPWISPR